MSKRDPDYTGPTWNRDASLRVGYLSIDNTRVVARTEALHQERPWILMDYDESGNVLGIEVLW